MITDPLSVCLFSVHIRRILLQPMTQYVMPSLSKIVMMEKSRHSQLDSEAYDTMIK